MNLPSKDNCRIHLGPVITSKKNGQRGSFKMHKYGGEKKSQPARTRRRASSRGNWRAASTFITFPSQSSAATASVAVLFGGHRRRRYFVRLGRMRQLAVRMTPPRADDIQDKTPAPPRRRHLGLSHASSCCVFVSPAPWKSVKKRKQGHCCVAQGLPPLPSCASLA